MISCFIHTFPSMVVFAARWLPQGDGTRDLAHICTTEDCKMTLMEWYGYPAMVHCFWQLLYTIQYEGFDGEKVRADKEIQSSIRWLTAAKGMPVTRMGAKLGRALGLLAKDEWIEPEKWNGKITFALMNFVMFAVMTLPVKLMWDYYYCGLVGLLLPCAAGIWNGASYYMKVFSKRYIDELPSRKGELRGMVHVGSDEASAPLCNGPG